MGHMELLQGEGNWGGSLWRSALFATFVCFDFYARTLGEIALP
jgi:hypothetical protein